MDELKLIRQELIQASDVLDRFMSDATCVERVQQAAELIANSILNGGKVISCGNGGSHCDAMHFAEELTGRYRDERRSLPAIAISDSSHITCVGNDYGYNHIFSRYISGLGKEGDVLLAISTSGKSQNIISAAEKAKSMGMKVVALTGNSGDELGEISDIEIRVPHYGYADRIQELHIKIIHILILLIEKKCT